MEAVFSAKKELYRMSLNVKFSICQWHCSGVIIFNFEQTLHIVLVFPLLPLNK